MLYVLIMTLSKFCHKERISALVVEPPEDADDGEEDEVGEHEARLCNVDSTRERVQGTVVDEGEEGGGHQGDEVLQAAQHGVDLPQVSLLHSLGQQGSDHCGHLRTQQTCNISCKNKFRLENLHILKRLALISLQSNLFVLTCNVE